VPSQMPSHRECHHLRCLRECWPWRWLAGGAPPPRRGPGHGPRSHFLAGRSTLYKICIISHRGLQPRRGFNPLSEIRLSRRFQKRFEGEGRFSPPTVDETLKDGGLPGNDFAAHGHGRPRRRRPAASPRPGPPARGSGSRAAAASARRGEPPRLGLGRIVVSGIEAPNM
jgi:hypothetical protein